MFRGLGIEALGLSVSVFGCLGFIVSWSRGFRAEGV